MRTLTAAWAQLTAKPSRIVASLITIVIGIGFACAALVFTSTFKADFAARLSVEYAGADVVVTNNGPDPAAKVAARVAAIPGVADAEPLYGSNLEFTSERAHNYLHLATVTRDPALRWAQITEGSWPTDSHGIVVSRDTATASNLTIGSVLTITGSPSGDGGSEPTLRTTVVGIADTSAAPLQRGRLTGFLVPSAFDELGVTYAPAIAVIARPGVDPAQLAAAVQNALGSSAVVRTLAEQADHDVAAYTGQTTALTTVLLGFAAIALLVAALVIVNTFTILLAGRRRQIALMRCVGATGAQVRREALVEAGIIGAAGSVVGAGLGIAVGALGARLAGVDSGGFVASPTGIALIAAIGVALTVGAAVLPASRAMCVPPLAALRPVDTVVSEQRASRVRAGIGVVLLVGGAAMLAAGVAGRSLSASLSGYAVPVAILGGATSAIGVLLLTRTFLPPLLRAIGGIGRAAGVSGHLAATNAVRNPGRAAATSAALVVGVGLIVMLQVAAASVGASVDKASVDRYPVDISVVGDGAPLSGSVISGIKAIPQLSQAISIPGAAATVTRPDGTPALDENYYAASRSDTAGTNSGPSHGVPVTMMGIPTGAADIVRGGLDPLKSDDDGVPTALVPIWWVSSGQVHLGDRLVITVNGHSQEFVAAVGRLTDSGVLGMPVMVTRSAFDAIVPASATQPVAVWAGLDSPDDAATVMAQLNDLTMTEPDLYVYGSAADRAGMQSLLSTVTAVATGLLGVAVVIAVVGIGNTIGLSVMERTRESALLRALGLRRGQLRLMLALESLLLALLGALLGIVLGLAYGWAGAAATFHEIGQDLVLSVPWGMVGLVLLVAVAAGVASSVLPARRAARTPPVAALAEE